MIECILITKTDGAILYSAHYGANQSLSSVQETEETIYRLTNQAWNQAKGKHFDVASTGGKLIVFTNVEDLLFFAVRGNQNTFDDDEMSLMELLDHIIEGLTALCAKKGLCYATLQELYPTVCLTVAEYVRDGVSDQIDVATAEDLAQFKAEKKK